jgi:vacuolar-type H+-ATPase subunit C/Vma6
MAVDLTYTGGVIAAREKYLLKDKLSRMCELSADDAFRILLESGFGGGEGGSVYDYDKLVSSDDSAIDDFIREYAPSDCEKTYLLATRDFHNAKAFFKAELLHSDVAPLLAPQGLISVDTLSTCFKNDNFSALTGALGEAIVAAIAQAKWLDEKNLTGAQVGVIFDGAMYSYLLKACRKNSALKKMICQKIDYTNILTAFRSESCEQAEKYYLYGGKLDKAKLNSLITLDDNARLEFYPDFVKTCCEAKKKGLPYTLAEKMKDSLEFDYLDVNKYELKRAQPFLYYVFRRRLENENVRIIFVCLLSGMGEREIKSRLRGV